MRLFSVTTAAFLMSESSATYFVKIAGPASVDFQSDFITDGDNQTTAHGVSVNSHTTGFKASAVTATSTGSGQGFLQPHQHKMDRNTCNAIKGGMDYHVSENTSGSTGKKTTNVMAHQQPKGSTTDYRSSGDGRYQGVTCYSKKKDAFADEPGLDD